MLCTFTLFGGTTSTSKGINGVNGPMSYGERTGNTRFVSWNDTELVVAFCGANLRMMRHDVSSFLECHMLCSILVNVLWSSSWSSSSSSSPFSTRYDDASTTTNSG
eukprot:6243776-Amphidinium_carterae.1